MAARCKIGADPESPEAISTRPRVTTCVGGKSDGLSAMGAVSCDVSVHRL